MLQWINDNSSTTITYKYVDTSDGRVIGEVELSSQYAVLTRLDEYCFFHARTTGKHLGEYYGLAAAKRAVEQELHSTTLY